MPTIRLAHHNELAKLSIIEHNAAQRFATTPYAYLLDDQTLALEILEQQQQLGLVWVAVDEHDEPVGFAVADMLGDEAYLHEIDVEPQHGRQGLGKRLISTVCAWARQADYQTITLSTFVDVPWNAPFYATQGFAIVADSDLTPAMREERGLEAEAGLPVDRRVFMRLSTDLLKLKM